GSTFKARLAGGSPAVVVGDSWVDGVAAAKAGVPFVAYRARQPELDRWRGTPITPLTDLALLPAPRTLPPRARPPPPPSPGPPPPPARARGPRPGAPLAWSFSGSRSPPRLPRGRPRRSPI